MYWCSIHEVVCTIIKNPNIQSVSQSVSVYGSPKLDSFVDTLYSLL